MIMLVLNTCLITLTIFCSLMQTCIAEYVDSDLLLTKSAFQKIMARLSDLETRVQIQQQRITELESRGIAQEKITTDLEAVVRKQHEEIEEMKTVLATKGHSNDHNVTRDVIREADEKVGKNQNEGSSTAVNIAHRIQRQQPEEETVAFTAIRVNPQNDLGLNQNVIFNHVETNIGNAYNQHQGVFVAPIAGTYVFHVTVFALYNAETWCKIVVNGVNKVDVYARGEASHHDQGSQTLVVRLDQGDDVSIQNAHAHDNVFGSSNNWTTFSGFLLHSDAVLSHIVGK